jgi:DNA-binding response OmpR family regulator
MVVDDDDTVRELVTRVARAAGFEVLLAANGCDAVKLLACGAYDVLVTDIYMPDKDGLELIQQARALHPALQIIAMSSGGTYGYDPLRAAGQLGAAQVLAKPFEVSQLLESFRRTVRGSGAP